MRRFGSDSVTEISRFPGITWEMVVADRTVRPIGNQWYLHSRNTAPADSGLWTFDTRGRELLDAAPEGVLFQTPDDSGVAVIERWSWESP